MRRLTVIATTLAVLIAGSAFTMRSLSGQDGGLKDTSSLQGVPYMEVNQTYKVLLGAGAIDCWVMAITKGGFAIVQIAEDGSALGMSKGTTFYLNLKLVSLVQLKNPRSVKK